jgi:hypothetical protein
MTGVATRRPWHRRGTLAIIAPLVLIGNQALAQQVPASGAVSADSTAMREQMKAAYMDRMAWKRPVMRQAGISTDVFAAARMRSELHGRDFYRAKLQAVRTNAYFNLPVAHMGSNRLSFGTAVSHQTIHLNEVEPYEPTLPVDDITVHNTLLHPSLNFTRTDSLFKRPTVYSVTASGLIEPRSGQTQFGGTAMVLITLRQTKKSTLSVGLIGMVDPAAPFPAIPIITYSHRFNPDLELAVDPSGIALRKEFGERSSLTLGNTIGSNLSLFKRDIVNLPIKQAYSTFEMKSGLTYEHWHGKKLVTTLSAGASTLFTSKVLDRDADEAFIKNTQSATPYVRLGVSFLPFWGGFVK